MQKEANPIPKNISVIFAGLLLVVLISSVALPSQSEESVSAMGLLQAGDTETPTVTLENTSTPTFTSTPTVTPTPLTGLTLLGWSKGCTSGPYIPCSASVTSTHTDPYRWDFDITYSYNDNRTNFGSNFSLTLNFATGVVYTDVPIYWNMYPITNEVMPNQRINVIYSGVSDLNPMAYPSGTWIIPAQPAYNKFDLIFSRGTSAPEILVRTDKWHLTLSTYPNTATPTTTPTPTVTPSQTPTSTVTITPTNTFVSGTPRSNGSGQCWGSGISWAGYIVYYDILTSSIPGNIVEADWLASIESAAQTWNDVSPILFSFVHQDGSNNTIRFEVPNPPTILAGSFWPPPTGIITSSYTRFNPNYIWDTNNTPFPGNPGNNGSAVSYNIQNVMTHEFGHWLFLEDMYDSNCANVTMDGTVGHGELIKIDLDVADREAINWQYP